MCKAGALLMRKQAGLMEGGGVRMDREAEAQRGEKEGKDSAGDHTGGDYAGRREDSH